MQKIKNQLIPYYNRNLLKKKIITEADSDWIMYQNKFAHANYTNKKKNQSMCDIPIVLSK
jgi:hypothetical protein